MNILFAQTGNLFTSLANYVPVFLISGFSNGALSMISYGTRFSEAVSNFFIVQFSIILGVKLNDLFAREQMLSEINTAVQNALRSILFIVCPICALTIIFSSEIITILFCHGSFKQENVPHAAFYLQIFISVLPFTIMNVVVAKLFMAAQKIDKSFIYQIVMCIIMSGLIYGGVYFFRVPGYPMALLLFNVFNTILSYIIVKRYLPYIDYCALCKILLLFIFVCAALAFPVYYIHSFYPHTILSIILILMYFSGLIVLNGYFKFSTDADSVIRRTILKLRFQKYLFR